QQSLNLRYTAASQVWTSLRCRTIGLQPLPQRHGSGLEPHHRAPLLEPLAIVCSEYDAAAGGNHVAFQRAQLAEDHGFCLPKRLRALLSEKVPDAATVGLVKHLIGVEKVPPQSLRQKPSHR